MKDEANVTIVVGLYGQFFKGFYKDYNFKRSILKQ